MTAPCPYEGPAWPVKSKRSMCLELVLVAATVVAAHRMAGTPGMIVVAVLWAATGIAEAMRRPVTHGPMCPQTMGPWMAVSLLAVLVTGLGTLAGLAPVVAAGVALTRGSAQIYIYALRREVG